MLTKGKGHQNIGTLGFLGSFNLIVALFSIAWLIIIAHMGKKKTLRSRYDDFMYDHEGLKKTVSWTWALLVTAVSSFIFAFGYKVFLAPTVYSDGTATTLTRIVSGGGSGISMTIEVAIHLISGGATEQYSDLIYSILYFVVNVPLFFLAWSGIGKRFTVLTFMNVLLVSVFINLLNLLPEGNVLEVVANFINQNGGMMSRAFFAGICTGLSSALAFKIDSSSGGVDVLAYYIALKKSVLVGKYSALINAVIVVSYTVLSGTHIGWSDGGVEVIGAAFYSIVYMVVVTLVIDLINVRNKKCEITVVTSNPDLAAVIMAQIPHGATVQTGKGAFSGNEKSIITMVISSYEVNDTVRIIRQADPNSFVKVTDLKQVYGRFFIKPIK